jgi:flagellar hook-associated protein 1
MSLFGTLQMTGNTLQAMQVGLHVAGNNIANANSPGFIREEVLYAPAPVQKRGNLVLGLGVEIAGIVQKVDSFLADRLRDAAGDTSSAEVQDKAYKDLENLLGALDSERSLSSQLSEFFGAIKKITESGAEPRSVQSLAIGQGKILAQNIGQLDRRVLDLRSQLNTQVEQTGAAINELTSTIQQLNIRISAIEGGGAGNSEAGALRTQRQNAVADLSKLVGITTNEQPSGGISVAVGGEFLVFEGIRREVAVVSDTVDGLQQSEVQFADTQSTLELNSGKLAGLVKARDDIAGNFHDSLNEFTGTLIYEFNKLYSQGQGITGFQSLTSQNGVTDPDAPLDSAGLPFTPTDGSFKIIVRDKNSKVSEETNITINLKGVDGDTTLNGLAAQLNAVDGISASVGSDGRLTISADGAGTDFSFRLDDDEPANGEVKAKQDNESGILAALGLNTFFTGDSALNISVNQKLNGIAGASYFAASRGGIGNDSNNALELENFFSRPLESLEGASLATRYDQLANELTQGSTVAGSVLEGYQAFEATLDAEFQAISGVNLDEEAINMITLQRIYQASARLVRTISEMLDVLVNL